MTYKACPTWGPSPLARGEQLRGVVDRFEERTIPAGAGRTRSWYSRLSSFRDHPRWRGENSLFFCQYPHVPGPSPLARGEQYIDGFFIPVPGTIPAGAGRTALQGLSSGFLSDHPRWRGENRLGIHSPSLKFGPSPLARGELHQLEDQLPGTGTIPAGAGRTSGRAE